MNILLLPLLLILQLQNHETGVFLSPACGPRHGGVYVVAHRGAHDGIPENTLAAYRRAIELGADFVEIDLRETKDGHLVSVHNATVDAYTKDATGDVSSFTLAALKALDISSRVGSEWAEERIPTFEEILEVCKGKIGIYLDLKHANVEKALALIHQYEMEKDIVWYAGTPQLRKVQEQCPECPLMPEIGSGEKLSRIVKLLAPKVAASTWDALSEAVVTSCHEAGIKLIVDDGGPDTWNDMLSWGVDGIQTDDVDGLIERLKETKAP